MTRHGHPLDRRRLLRQGLPGPQGVAQAQVDAGYVHFHKEAAANLDQAHMTDPANSNAQGPAPRVTDMVTSAAMPTGVQRGDDIS